MRDRRDRWWHDHDVRRRAGLLALAVLVVAISVALVRRGGASDGWEDPERFAGSETLIGHAPAQPSAALGRPIRVAVVRDPASEPYHGAERLDAIVARWVAALAGLGADARVVSPEALRASDADVVVVPATPCIGVETHRAITDAGRLRRGLVITWLTGVRDAGCAPLGYGLLVELTGAARVDTLESRSESYVVFPDGGALATDIPPGARLELLIGNHVALRRAGRDAFHADFSLNPAPASGQPLLDAAVVHGERAGGRVVYWGFDLGSVAERPWSRAVAQLLLRNSVLWAAGEPLPELEPWPRGHIAAAVIAQDVEDQFANARHALDTLRAVGVRGTYFLVTDLARDHRELVAALAEQGEIGSHTENHRLLGGLPADLQARRLERTQDQLRRLTGTRVAGLRPPEEQFDLATIAAWRAAGGTYVAAANDARVASPEIFLDGGEPVVLLGRAVNDDYAVLSRAGITGPADQARVYLADAARMRALGGLYFFSFHSHLQSRPEYVGALGKVARELAGDPAFWVVPAGEIADWWRARAAVRVTVADGAANGDETIVRVRNDGAAAFEGAVLRVAVGGQARVWHVTLARGTGPTSPASARVLAAEPGFVRVELPRLEPGVETTVRIAIERGRGGRAG